MDFGELIHYLLFNTTRYLTPETVAAEWFLVIVSAVAAVWLPGFPEHWQRRIRAAFRGVANRKGLAILICGVLPIALRLLLLFWIPPPVPSIHDEFSHLLLGDTLAHGRMSNPTHPMWMHLESIHILQKPTYSSMYPPGQGTVLAAGQIIFGHPWAGVLMSVGIMCAAVCWMMQGWLPPIWALFGTLVLILKIGVTGMWMNSYLSGAVASTGGALLIGALPRLRSSRSLVVAAVAAGLGVVILVNTRPLDTGLLTLVAVAYAIVVAGPALRARRTVLFRQLALPLGVVLLAGAILTCYYCWRVTGSPFRMPYQVNRATYGWPENLAFLPPVRIQPLRHAAMQSMYELEVHNHDAYANVRSAIADINTRIFDNWTYFAGPILTVPFLFFPAMVRKRRYRPLVLFVAVIAVLNLFQLVLYPYHLGPVVPVFYALAAAGLRYLYLTVYRSNPASAGYVLCAVPICLLLMGGLKQKAEDLGILMSYWEHAHEPHRDARAQIVDWLRSRPGKHLVVVRYKAEHNPNQEWVYNLADVDSSQIVWSREMDEEQNAKLFRYFRDRRAWLVEADVFPPRVLPYRPPSADTALESDPTYQKN